jgi:hypothetical protein
VPRIEPGLVIADDSTDVGDLVERIDVFILPTNSSISEQSTGGFLFGWAGGHGFGGDDVADIVNMELEFAGVDHAVMSGTHRYQIVEIGHSAVLLPHKMM